MTIARYAIDVRGLVQGVGFRPFVHALAREHALSGVVYNDPGGVHIEVEGKRTAIERFVRALRDAPAPAAVEEIACRHDLPNGDTAFRIVETSTRGSATAATPGAELLGKVLDRVVCERAPDVALRVEAERRPPEKLIPITRLRERRGGAT